MHSRRSVVTALGIAGACAGCVSSLRSDTDGGAEDTREPARVSFEPLDDDELVDQRYTVRVSVEMGDASEVLLRQNDTDAGTILESTNEAELLVDSEESTRVEAVANYPNGDDVTVAEACFECE